jgi:WD40 repeat protein
MIESKNFPCQALTKHTPDLTLWAVRFQNAQTLISCGSSGSLFSHSSKLSQSTSITSTSGVEKTIRNIAIAPSGEYYATCSFDSTITVHEAQQEHQDYDSVITTLSGHGRIPEINGKDNEVKSLCYSPDSSLLASAGRDKTVCLSCI